MANANHSDDEFLRLAQARRLLTQGQIAALRHELRRRSAQNPGTSIAELAVEKGMLDAGAARALLAAHGAGAQAARDAEPTSLRPEDDQFNEVPRLIEPLPVIKPRGAAGPRNPSEDSHLEMELPPPGSPSGDSLFDEGSTPNLAPLPVTPTPGRIPEATQSPILVERTPSAFDESLGSTNLGLESESHAAPTWEDNLSSADTLNGLTDEEDSAVELEPQTQSQPKMGTGPLPMLDDEPVQLAPSSALNESAVRDVMRDADDGYFGRPADLTRPGFDENVLAVDKVEEVTLFDSEKDIDQSAPQGVAPDDTDFSRTRATAPGKPPSKPPSRPPSKPSTKPPITEINDDSDVNFGVTLAGDTIPAGNAKTVYDDSEVGIEEEITGEITSEPTTGSRTSGMSTAMATGEVGGRKRNKVGVESNITDDQNLAGEQISASQVTIADIRSKMGIGAGVKIADGQDTAMKVVKRLKQGGGAYKRYTVIREIARGGMGKVLEVEDNDLRRSVALKVLRKEMLGRKDLVERFLEEAQITGQLEHPNIVPVHEIGVDGRGNLYFTMKLVEGEELSNILKRLRQGDANARQSYPLSRLIETFIKLCEGLGFAHSRGVIHRDLKPANIMVGRFGEVQIMDWGVAKIVGSKEETAERIVGSDRRDAGVGTTMVGAILGTPTYMSPEQARGETETLNIQSDIFSLGVILYELLCLKLPWTGKNSEEILEQVREANPQPPSARDGEKNIPPDLEQLAMRCLEKDPRKRIQSTQDLIDNLRSWQEGRTLAAVQYTFSQLFKKWLARHRKSVILGSIMVLLLVGGSVGTFIAIDQQRKAEIPGRLTRGQEFLAQAVTARENAQPDQANEHASKARAEFEAVLQIEKDNAKAKEGLTAASLEQARMQASLEAAAQEKARREKEAERLQKLSDALKRADAARDAAEDAAKSAAQAGRPVDAAVKSQFDKAREEYLAVLALEPTHARAGEEKLRIDKWLADYTQGEENARQFTDLGAKLAELRQKAQAARALLGGGKKFEDAKNPVLEVIRLSDLALAVPLSDAPARKLKGEAAQTKAEITLEYAKMALAQQPPKFEVCDLMLSIAEITGERAAEAKAQRSEYETKRAQAERFQELLKTAEYNINNQLWTAAVRTTSEALAEAEKSKYATAQDKERLAKMAQFAQMEEVQARVNSATTSDQFGAIVGEFERLLKDVLKDADYVQRCEGYLLQVRSKLGVALLEEARNADDATALDLLARALKHLSERAHRVEAQKRIDEITARKALSDLSDKLVLLPRGAFIVGSLKDSDYNTQRTVEQEKIVFMDRTPVTNSDYLEFVAAGGYANEQWWDKDALAIISSFVDSTGAPGPKAWVKGGFDASLGNVPVTGISCFEARAYARFRGKRLPTADEWEVAAGAPLAARGTASGDYAFGSREDAPALGVPRLRDVGTAEWDHNVNGIKDLGHNCAEWTDSADAQGRSIIKGAETGIRPDLFLRYARRAKNSFAKMADRTSGRGFRCAQDYVPKKEG
jgi:serine/threonine protein kinase/formylglycine-generating enzyme required for sulfatase activity